MARTVRVRLELDREDYKRGLRDAAADTRGFDAEVRAAGKDASTMGAEIKSAGTEVQAMGREADTTAKKTTTLGSETRKAKEETAGLGGETDKTKEKSERFREESTKTRARIVDLAADIDKTKASIKALGVEFQRTGQVNLDELGKLNRTLRELERAKSEVDSILGTNQGAEKARTNIVDLGKDIEKTKTALKDMGDEWRKTGNVDMDSFKKVTGELRALERAKADLAKLTPGDGKKDNGGLLGSLDQFFAQGVRKAGTAGKDMANAMGDSIAKNPIISTAIIAGVTIGVPVIAAAVGSAIAAGVGFGFGAGTLALGISRAAADSRVQEAWGTLFAQAGDRLQKDSATFVGPLLTAADTVRGDWSRAIEKVSSSIRSMAPLVNDLASGTAGFLNNVTPGIDNLTRAARPFIEDFAAWLPELGQHISDFAASMEKAGPGAQAFFNDMLSLINGTVDALGWLAEAGSRAYLYLGGVGDLASGKVTTGLSEMWAAATGNTKAFQLAGDAVQGTSEKLALLTGNAARASDGSIILATDYGALTKSLSGVSATADTVAGAMAGRMLTSMMSLDQATLGFAQSQTHVSDSIKQNGLELDIHTVKGQGNTQAILASVQANMAQYQANIAAGMSATDAAKAYDGNTKALEDQLRAAGFTQGAIDGLVGKYRDVPKNVNTDIATKGLTEALGGLEEVIRKANGLNGRVVTMTLEEVHRTTYTSDTPPSQFFRGNRWGGAYEHAAAGTLREASTYSARNPGRYMIAEPQTGGEAFIPKSGNYGRSMSILSQAASWYGAQVMPGGAGGGTYAPTFQVNVNAGMGTNGMELAHQIAGVLRPLINSVGGGNVQVALGRPGS